MAEAASLIGVSEPLIVCGDIGGTTSRITLGTNDEYGIGDIQAWGTLPDLDQTIDAFARNAEVMLGGRKPDAVGCAIAGEISEDGSTITRAGKLNEYGWLNQPIANKLASALGIDNYRAFLFGDVQAAGYAEREAERRQGAPGEDTGLIETVSTGNGGAIYGPHGSTNVEPGHIDSGKDAPVPCGCGGERCIEAWIGGDKVGAAWGVSLKDADRNDPRWNDYRANFNEMQLIKLRALEAQGYVDLRRWTFYGSVALKGPGIITNFARHLAIVRPNIDVAPARWGDDSGLAGANFGAKERLVLAA